MNQLSDAMENLQAPAITHQGECCNVKKWYIAPTFDVLYARNEVQSGAMINHESVCAGGVAS